jgi:hypothetical protein
MSTTPELSPGSRIYGGGRRLSRLFCRERATVAVRWVAALPAVSPGREASLFTAARSPPRFQHTPAEASAPKQEAQILRCNRTPPLSTTCRSARRGSSLRYAACIPHGCVARSRAASLGRARAAYPHARSASHANCGTTGTAVSRVGFAAETSSGNGSRPFIAK